MYVWMYTHLYFRGGFTGRFEICGDIACCWRGWEERERVVLVCGLLVGRWGEGDGSTC